MILQFHDSCLCGLYLFMCAEEAAQNLHFQKLFHTILLKANTTADRNNKNKLFCTHQFFICFSPLLSTFTASSETCRPFAAFFFPAANLSLTHWSVSFIYHGAAVRLAAQSPQELLLSVGQS